jgi:transcriptional regulator with XRE-family HTH domain
MNDSSIHPLLERQLLLQLGNRLKSLRKAQGLGTVEVARRAKLTRNTLRSVEAGEPSPSIGAYIRVMSVLGISAELALLAGEIMHPPTKGTLRTKSLEPIPVVQIKVLADSSGHKLQDLQSLALHEVAVELVKGNPSLLLQAQKTLRNWLERGDERSAKLWIEWDKILKDHSWRKVLSQTRRAQQLRQSSPLVTILPDKKRQEILSQVSSLKRGVILSNESNGMKPFESQEACA